MVCIIAGSAKRFNHVRAHRIVSPQPLPSANFFLIAILCKIPIWASFCCSSFSSIWLMNTLFIATLARMRKKQLRWSIPSSDTGESKRSWFVEKSFLQSERKFSSKMPGVSFGVEFGVANFQIFHFRIKISWIYAYNYPKRTLVIRNVTSLSKYRKRSTWCYIFHWVHAPAPMNLMSKICALTHLFIFNSSFGFLVYDDSLHILCFRHIFKIERSARAFRCRFYYLLQRLRSISIESIITLALMTFRILSMWFELSNNNPAPSLSSSKNLQLRFCCVFAAHFRSIRVKKIHIHTKRVDLVDIFTGRRIISTFPHLQLQTYGHCTIVPLSRKRCT